MKKQNKTISLSAVAMAAALLAAAPAHAEMSADQVPHQLRSLRPLRHPQGNN